MFLGSVDFSVGVNYLVSLWGAGGYFYCFGLFFYFFRGVFTGLFIWFFLFVGRSVFFRGFCLD